jgi:hypothetical protein
MMGALLADRPEQQAGKPAVPAGADNQEIITANSVDEHFGWVAPDELALDLDALGIARDFGDHSLKHVLRGSVGFAHDT